VENIFKEYFLGNLKGSPPFVRLEKMNKPGQRVTGLIETTAKVLSSGTVALMLLAKQKDDLEKGINQAIKWAVSDFTRKPSTERIIKLCIAAFMSIWYLEKEERREREEEALQEDLQEETAKEEAVRKAVKEEAVKEEEQAVKEEEELAGELLDEEGEERLDELLEEFFEEDDFFFRSRSEANAIFSKLNTFFANPPLLISTDDHLHHQLIGIVLILEHVCLSYASSLKPTRDEALDQAYSRYCASEIHNEVTRQFSAPTQVYSTDQFTTFITTNGLK